MSARNHSSVAKPRTLSADMDAVTTSMQSGPTASTAWPAAPFIVVIERGTSNEELLLVTAGTGVVDDIETLTVARGYDGTTAKAHRAGVKVEHVTAAIDHRESVSTQGGDTIAASAPAVIPLVVKGAAGQTANLLEAQNSAGTMLARIAASGAVVSETLGTFGPSAAGLLASSASLSTIPAEPTRKGLVVRGAASQSANLSEWQDSAGTVKTVVNNSGSVGTVGLFRAGDLAFDTGMQANITSQDATRKGLVVRGAASQSANLAEFQNSAGTVLTAIEGSLGVIKTKHIDVDSNVWVGFGGLGGTRADLPKLIARGAPSQAANLAEFQNSAGTVLAGVGSDGRYLFSPSNSQTGVGPSGSASALPSNPVGYLLIRDTNGISRAVPYYNA